MLHIFTMAIIMGIFGKGKRKEGEYIDLSEYGSKVVEEEAEMYVKVAELQKYEDVKDFMEHVYNGNILILDLEPLSYDDMELERTTNELKRVVKDIGGDIAGLGRNLVIVTPEKIKIDRRKMRAPF